MDVFKNGNLGYLSGFLILVVLIIPIILIVTTSGSSSRSEPELEWVAVGNDSTNYGNIMYSSDGKKWTETSTRR